MKPHVTDGQSMGLNGIAIRYIRSNPLPTFKSVANYCTFLDMSGHYFQACFIDRNQPDTILLLRD